MPISVAGLYGIYQEANIQSRAIKLTSVLPNQKIMKQMLALRQTYGKLHMKPYSAALQTVEMTAT